MVTKQLDYKNKHTTFNHVSPGHFARKAVLISALALASPVLIAQVAPQYHVFPPSVDTVKFTWLRSDYKHISQPNISLEYLTGVRITMVKRPKEDILLPEGVVLSVAEQKKLFHQEFTENDKYAFFYFAKYSDWPYNNFYVFRKKQNMPNSSDTLK
ncbi:MAG: hypothetical protein WC263_02715 [Candidatus Micrarchaeia archaeon]